jgi:hypothetical protein
LASSFLISGLSMAALMASSIALLPVAARSPCGCSTWMEEKLLTNKYYSIDIPMQSTVFKTLQTAVPKGVPRPPAPCHKSPFHGTRAHPATLRLGSYQCRKEQFYLAYDAWTRSVSPSKERRRIVMLKAINTLVKSRGVCVPTYK